VGLMWNDRDTTETIGPQGGVKFFVHDSAFLNLVIVTNFSSTRLRRLTTMRVEAIMFLILV
jgi:hypothetical protein